MDEKLNSEQRTKNDNIHYEVICKGGVHQEENLIKESYFKVFTVMT